MKLISDVNELSKSPLGVWGFESLVPCGKPTVTFAINSFVILDRARFSAFYFVAQNIWQ